jgi:hypothetical protein
MPRGSTAGGEPRARGAAHTSSDRQSSAQRALPVARNVVLLEPHGAPDVHSCTVAEEPHRDSTCFETAGRRWAPALPLEAARSGLQSVDLFLMCSHTYGSPAGRSESDANRFSHATNAFYNDDAYEERPCHAGNASSLHASRSPVLPTRTQQWEATTAGPWPTAITPRLANQEPPMTRTRHPARTANCTEHALLA